MLYSCTHVATVGVKELTLVHCFAVTSHWAVYSCATLDSHLSTHVASDHVKSITFRSLSSVILQFILCIFCDPLNTWWSWSQPLYLSKPAETSSLNHCLQHFLASSSSFHRNYSICNLISLAWSYLQMQWWSGQCLDCYLLKIKCLFDRTTVRPRYDKIR